MAETLLQKAQRLGVQPAGKPAASSTPSGGESLMQKAQRLGMQPAQFPEKSPGLFSVNTLKGETSYKADQGGAGPILSNIVRTFGNIPSSAAKLIRGTISPVNPFDRDSPLNIGSNIVKSVISISDMIKTKRETEETIRKDNENIAKLQAQRGEKPTYQSNNILPSNKSPSIVKDIAGGFGSTAKKGYELYRGLGDKIYNNLEKNVNYSDSVLGGVGISAAEGVSKIATAGIEDPLLIPSLIYGGPKAAGAKGDAISDTARIFTRGADTSIPNILKKVTPSRAGAIDDLEQTYTDLMSGTTPGKKKIDKLAEKTAALDRAGTTGRTPQRTLAESGVIPNRSGPKLDTYDQAKQYRETTAPLREANRKALEEVGLSTSPVKLDDLEARAISNAKTPANVNGGRFESMEKQIQARFAALRKAYPTGEIPLSVVDDIKSAHWDNVFGNKSLVEADRLAKDSDYAIAKAMQKDIEEIAEKAGHKDVAQLNREIGDRLEAARYLEDLNGKTIKGGRLLKYVTTGIGSAMGTTIPGKIVGALGGNLIGELIIANNVANPIKRFLLRNLQAKDPEAYLNTIKWLEKQDLDRETRLLLPGPSGMNTEINQGRALPVLPRDNRVIESTGKDIMGGSSRPAETPKSTSPAKPLDDIRIYEPYEKDLPVIEAGTVPKKKSILPVAKGAPNVYQSKSPTSQQTKPAITKVNNKPILSTLPSKSNVSKEVIPSSKKKDNGIPNKEGGFIKLSGENDDISILTPKKRIETANSLIGQQVRFKTKTGGTVYYDSPKDYYKIISVDNLSQPSSLKSAKDFSTVTKIVIEDSKGRRGEFDIKDFSGFEVKNGGQQGKITANPLTIGAGILAGGAAIAKVATMDSKPITYTKEEPKVLPKAKPNVENVIKSIKYNESRGEENPYAFSQHSGTSSLGRALGAYQITEGELKTYAKRYLGKAVSAKEFLASEALQDKYIKNRVEELIKRGLSVEDILAVHNKGGSDLTPEGLKKVREKAKEYIESGMEIYVTK